MHTFYIPPKQISDREVKILGLEHHHLRNVLRLEPGEIIRIIDGNGNVLTAKIFKINNESTDSQVVSQESFKRKTPSLTLFQALPKNDKMELIIQKTIELGVSQIVPLFTERSLQKPSENRCDRWRRIAISATKQCRSAWLPELCNVLKYEECLNTLNTFSLSLILWENEKQQNIRTFLRQSANVDSIALIVGPEGGFDRKEINAAIEKGCIPVSIGSNLLRTETAAIAIIAITAYEFQI